MTGWLADWYSLWPQVKVSLQACRLGGFGGFGRTAPPAGEVRDPGRVGRAIFCVAVLLACYGTCKRSCQSALWPKLHSLSWVIVSEKSEKGNGQLRVAEAWIRAIP